MCASEAFVTGAVIAHTRGRTITDMDSVLLTLLAMNTAQAHFNEQMMRDSEFGRAVVFGGVTAAMVIGLAAEDTAGDSAVEIGLADMRFLAPVFVGDTLHAFSEVLAVEEAAPKQPMVVTFRHWGVNQRDETVLRVDRRVMFASQAVPAETHA